MFFEGVYDEVTVRVLKGCVKGFTLHKGSVWVFDKHVCKDSVLHKGSTRRLKELKLKGPWQRYMVHDLHSFFWEL